MKRGIYLVANRRSQRHAESLVTSIRSAGCELPIAVVNFGGEPLVRSSSLNDVVFLDDSSFSPEAFSFVSELSSSTNQCPLGYLKRFLALFGPFDEFVYSDNDIVAVLDWGLLFDSLGENLILHADHEYLTNGRFCYRDATRVAELLGSDVFQSAITAGFFVMRRDARIVDALRLANEWIRNYPEVVIANDQTLLHLAIVLGRLPTVNLCQGHDRWMSPWAGDYCSHLDLLQKVASGGRLSHIHFSGGTPSVVSPLGDFLTVSFSSDRRLWSFVSASLREVTRWNFVEQKLKRCFQKLRAFSRLKICL